MERASLLIPFSIKSKWIIAFVPVTLFLSSPALYLWLKSMHMAGSKKKPSRKTNIRGKSKSARKAAQRTPKRDTLDTTGDEQPRSSGEYWNRVSNDAAHGYGAGEPHKKGVDSILNEDQEPGDQERGDA